jgi:hypothetical protein
MTETTKPSINRDFDCIEHKLVKSRCRWWEGIQTTLTGPVQQQLLHLLILNQEEEWVKFNKCVIIKSKAVNRDYIFMGGRDM